MIQEIMGLVEQHRQEVIKVMDGEGSLIDLQNAEFAIESALRELQSRLESLENVKSSLIDRMKDAHDISLDGEHSVARSVLLDAIDTAMQATQGGSNADKPQAEGA